jgi:serine protease Do
MASPAALAVLAAIAGSSPASAPGDPAAPRAAAARPGTLPELAPLAQAILPAVVGVITTAAPAEAPAGDAKGLEELFQRFHGDSPRQGLASGVIIHGDGWVLTNAHVVDGAGRVEVDLGDEGGKVGARVVGADPATDVALLKVEADHPLTAAPLGDSDRVQIAEWILVFGNPFGLAHSVTLGIVSQLGRSDISPAGREGYYDFIQTDASINPGNSGGPLVNLRGEVVGIATAINATGQGIGFAIPINMAKDVARQLQERGRVVRSWIGISVREAPREVRASRPSARGVLVSDVVSGGPAADAGLRVGDVITAFDGRDVATPARLRWLVASAGVGRRVALRVRRGDGERELQIRLAQLPTAEAEAMSRAGAGP